MQNASLVVVGSGVKVFSHLTQEAKSYIEQSDKVLYLVNEPCLKEWMHHQNPNAESLEAIYHQYTLRIDSYKAITNYILENLRKIQHVCVVIYGHPSVLAKPGLDAVLQARQEGFFAQVLPGISSIDCLFADLLIDPGSSGCQLFDASDFLIYKRSFDPSSHLILCQIDVIGVLNNPNTYTSSKGISLLVRRLAESYDLSHTVVLYEAAQYPSFKPIINKISLNMLPSLTHSSISTLYVPPKLTKRIDDGLLAELKLYA